MVIICLELCNIFIKKNLVKHIRKIMKISQKKKNTSQKCNTFSKLIAFQITIRKDVKYLEMSWCDVLAQRDFFL